MIEPDLVFADRAVLSEGPVWVEAEQALYWVDIKGRRVLRHLPRDRTTRIWQVPMRIMSLVPRRSGGFVRGSDHGLIAIDPDFTRFDVLCSPANDGADDRFNDGKTDRAGRYWSGTMDDGEVAADGALYRLDAGGDCARVDGGYRVTNGPAFSVDGTVMYHTDSALRTIYRFTLAPDGAPTDKRVFATFDEADGYPDGMTVDADDHLWVAFWDGWCVRRLSPASAITATLPLPVARPTSVAFGGPALDRLYITSATIGLDAAALAAQPWAGGLMGLDPGVRGVAETVFAG